jgi:ribonuclease HI
MHTAITTATVQPPRPSTTGAQNFMQQATMMNRYTIVAPPLLQGTRCYVDASTWSDQPNNQTRIAGLGVFILNLQVQPTQAIYIKARLLACTSVLMAEAASLALAIKIIHNLNITECNFLSDCQQLVNFINSANHSDPPDWRIKPFTQAYLNLTNTISARLIKINRNNNTTTDALARQARSSQGSSLQTMCSHQHGYDHCSVSQVLQFVDLHDVTLIVDLHDVTLLAARCC